MNNLHFEAHFENSFGFETQIPSSSLPEVVFSGRSNVGKSSLINSITNRKNLAKTSSHPGKTSTINFYNLRSFRFVDLPGYGYAKVSFKEKLRWSKLVEGYFKQKRNIALIIQLIDLRHPPTADDISMLNFLFTYSFPSLVVATKSDKLNKTNLSKRKLEIKNELSDFKNIEIISFSSVTKEGLLDIKNTIVKFLKNKNN